MILSVAPVYNVSGFHVVVSVVSLAISTFSKQSVLCGLAVVMTVNCLAGQAVKLDTRRYPQMMMQTRVHIRAAVIVLLFHLK